VNPSEMHKKAPLWRWKHRNRAPSTHKMNKMVMSEEQMKLPSTKKVEPQLGLENTKVTQTPENMLLAALMIVSAVSAGVPSNSEETATIENWP
ncbi:hypothetical protein H8958_001906, partial [Nasalis larvatus]